LQYNLKTNLEFASHKVSYVKRFVDLGACFRQNSPEMNPQIGLHNNSPFCRIFLQITTHKVSNVH